MLIIFGVVLVGFFAARRGLWAAELNKHISVFVLNVTAPLLILSSVMGEGLVFEAAVIGQLLLVSLLNYVILVVRPTRPRPFGTWRDFGVACCASCCPLATSPSSASPC